MSRSTFYFIAVLILAIALNIWLVRHISHQTDTNTPNTAPPNAFMKNATYTSYDQNGRLNMTITSPHVAHFNKNNQASIQQPNLKMLTKTDQHWTITADHAKSHRGAKSIDMIGHVIVTRPADQHQPGLTLKTSTLTIYPKQKTAQTQAPVTIIRPDVTVIADGLKANLNTGDIQLLGNVKANYLPPNQHPRKP